jgi:hypothetical protein
MKGSSNMRLLIAFLLMGATAGICQTVALEPPAELVVNRILSNELYSGWDEKILVTLGDGSAVALTKYLSERDPSPPEIRLSLFMIRRSFDVPEAIVIEADRRPRTALFVLKRLESLQLSDELRNEVKDTRKAILRASSK